MSRLFQILPILTLLAGCGNELCIHQIRINDEYRASSNLSTQEAISIAQDLGDKNGFLRKNFHKVNIEFDPTKNGLRFFQFPVNQYNIT